MSRALVTGGAGFIGAHLVRALVARGDSVAALDNLRRGSWHALPPGVERVEADIRDPAALRDAFADIDMVYHLAAQSNVLGALADPDYSFTTNVVGTYNVLQAARSTGVARVVFSSSREVYGEPAMLPVCEDTPLGAKNPYGASKVAGEAYCRVLACDSMATSILRFGNVYGPGDRDRVIPLWIARAARREPLEVFGGAQEMDFVPVDLAVRALLAATDRGVAGPVNVGTGIATRIGDLAERIRSFAQGQIEVVSRPARSAEVVRFVADVTRMRQTLGIEPAADPLCGLEALWAAERDLVRR